MRHSFLYLALSAGVAFGQPAPSAAGYSDLTNRIFLHGTVGREKALSFPVREDVDRITSQLHDMVTATIRLALSSPNASSTSVQKAMLDLQGQFALSVAYGTMPFGSNVPFADISSINGTPVSLAAFAIERGGGALPDVRAYLEFYTDIGGAWKLQTELGSDFNGTAFAVARIDSGIPSEVRYLVWGRVIGNPSGWSKATLYSFDGISARAVWENDDLDTLKVSVAGDRVTLDHYLELRNASGERVPVPPKHVVEVWRSVPSGFQLQSSTNLDN